MKNSQRQGNRVFDLTPNIILKKGAGARATGVSTAETSHPKRKGKKVMPNYGHFWTLDASGEKLAPKQDWYREGPACWVLGSDPHRSEVVPFWRFFSGASGTHFWTTDINGEQLGSSFHREGPAAYVYSSPIANTVPLYRFFSEKLGHFWTTDVNGELLPKEYFHLEGPACYVYPTPQPNDASLVPFWRFFNKPAIHPVPPEPDPSPKPWTTTAQTASITSWNPIRSETKPFYIYSEKPDVLIQLYGCALSAEISNTGTGEKLLLEKGLYKLASGNYAISVGEYAFLNPPPYTYVQITYAKRA